MERSLFMPLWNQVDLYGITDSVFAGGRTHYEQAAAMIAGGIRLIQYREKRKKARLMYEECLAIRQLTREAGVVFLVNDHVDLAMAVEADGVHVGQGDLPPAVLRRLLGDAAIIGLSTHAPEEVAAAVASGVVDYVGVGPVFATQTKEDVCAAVGLDYVAHVAARGDMPFVAIGGIKTHNIRQVQAAGARSFAVITDIVGKTDMKAAIGELRQALL